VWACTVCRTNVVMNYTEVEAKVREATNDEAWGPTGSQMQELAQYTFTYEHYPEVMAMLWRRMLYDNRNNWRRVYKVDFSGSRRAVLEKYIWKGAMVKSWRPFVLVVALKTRHILLNEPL